VRALAAGCDLLCIGTDNTAPQMEEIVAAIADAVDSGRLAGERVADAAARVRALAAGHPTPGGPSAAGSSAGSSLPIDLPAELGDRIAASFHVADGALARLGGGRIGTVVRIDTVPNIAVGGVPWGPFALLEEPDPGRPAPAWLTDAAVLVVDAGTPLADPVGLHGPVLVVGKDLHRHPFAAEAITRLRAARDDVVTVDMGWPSDDLALADIATFGASRAVSEALVTVIDRAVGAPSPAEAR